MHYVNELPTRMSDALDQLIIDALAAGELRLDDVKDILADKTLVVTDFKTRKTVDQVYLGDRLQIALGAAALRGHGKVADHGFVIVQDAAGRRKSHYVDFLTGTGLMDVVEKYVDIVTGHSEACKTEDRFKCRSCAHKAQCNR